MSTRSNVVPPDDWRRSGQEKVLKGSALRLETFRPPRPSWDHEHCECCYAKVSKFPGDLAQGWTTADHTHWICADCFADVRDEFEWTLVGEAR